MPWYQKLLEKMKTENNLKGLHALRGERGAVFVLTALLLPFMFGFLGLGYDVGNLYMHKARLQHAADAASLAGARAFVDETAAQTPVRERQYRQANNLSETDTLTTDAKNIIHATVKADAKAAAKTTAVANVNQNMLNLKNNQYSSIYSLITDTTEQQYFKAYMEETVHLYFLPVIMDKREQNVVAEAISTIIKQRQVKPNPDKPKPDPTDAQSLYMVKSGFNMLGTGFYQMDSTPSSQKGGHHPTWNGFFDGDLRYTGDSVSYNFGNQNIDRYDNTNFDRAFNSKALALLETVKPLSVLQGKSIEAIENSTEFKNFVAELKKNKDYWDNESLTAEGAEFINAMKTKLPTDDGYAHAYNYFYEKVRDNPYYYSSFRHIDYDMDSLGVALDKLFKDKQKQSLSAADKAGKKKYDDDMALWNEKYPIYEAAHNTWETSNPYNGKRLEEMQAMHTLLYNYREIYKASGEAAAINAWKSNGKPYMTEALFKQQVIYSNQVEWYTPDANNSWGYSFFDGMTMYNVPEPQISDYVKDDDKGIVLDHMPQLTDAKYSLSQNAYKTYYGEYVGPADKNSWKHDWKSSELYSYSADNSYFYYNNAVLANFDLEIDDGFAIGGDTGVTKDDPFYLYIGDDVGGKIGIQLKTDLKRPLVICYKGTKNPQIHIELNGHTFRGIIYTPNSSAGGGEHVHMNMGSTGKFEGTWMADSLTLKQANTGNTYVDYDLEENIEKAWPGYSEDNNENQNNNDDQNDDEEDQNRIKVIKLVKKVDNIQTEEIIN